MIVNEGSDLAPKCSVGTMKDQARLGVCKKLGWCCDLTEMDVPEDASTDVGDKRDRDRQMRQRLVW